MTRYILRFYDKVVLERPMVTLLLVTLIIGFFVSQIPKFKLDASAESLVLEKDKDLRYYRQMAERYGTSDILVLTYAPKKELFSKPALKRLGQLRDQLRKLAGVDSVKTILDVPLLYNGKLSLTDLAKEGKVKTLESPGVDPLSVRHEFFDNPLYRNRLLGEDGETTTILVNLTVDKPYRDLLERRYELREKEYDHTLTAAEARELAKVSEEFRQRLAVVTNRQNELVKNIRAIADGYRDDATLYLGGVPMIVADMIDFVANDLEVFSVGVFLFLILTLALIFRKKRWVFLTMLCCFASGVTMVGYLGLVDWRVTVISSNFISLMLIFTMSLTIHLIVRYREIHAKNPRMSQRELVLETVRLMFIPCFYTSLTTIVAFVSLLVSNIRPVMDFGMMMTIGLVVSIVLSFILFPACLALFKPLPPPPVEKGGSRLMLFFARLTERHGGKILLVSLLLAIISGVGISRLKVENRFIDYFRESTEIYQGMKVIDQKLGGTTPFDLVIDFKELKPVTSSLDEEDFFLDETEAAKNKQPWFVSSYRMGQMEKIHDYLESLPEIGEVLSIATTMKIATHLNDGVALDNYEIALINKKMPDDMREMLLKPYVSADRPEARVTMRVMETNKNLKREALLEKISRFLTEKMGLERSQFHFTNMFVLYNNMLQSLFRSQILTIGMTFLGIMVMFIILFRSLLVAIIAIIPNLLPAAMVLGTMGLAGIPLDMMTITIAGITIGIAVDDTIHYIHRYEKEFLQDHNYLAAMHRSHASIGRAMFYTSVTITIGFSILVLSNFMPTIYFGLFTGLAMVAASAASLTLLPKLMIMLKPYGKEIEAQ